MGPGVTSTTRPPTVARRMFVGMFVGSRYAKATRRKAANATVPQRASPSLPLSRVVL